MTQLLCKWPTLVWIATGRRFHQRIQRLEQVLILGGEWLATGARVTKPARGFQSLGPLCQFLFTQPNRALRKGRRAWDIGKRCRLGCNGELLDCESPISRG